MKMIEDFAKGGDGSLSLAIKRIMYLDTVFFPVYLYNKINKYRVHNVGC